MKQTMKILVIISNPERASFRQRVAVHLEYLRSEGISTKVLKLPPSPLQRRNLFQQAGDYDCVLLHKKALNYLDAKRLRKYSKKIIYDFDDAIMYSAQEPEKVSRKRQNAFQRTACLADMIIAGNSYLAEQAKKFNKKVEILPTSLDTKAYNIRQTSQNDGKIRLVWIGSKSTLRYLEEIRPALEEIGSRYDNAALRIVCDKFINLENMPVEKHNWSIETQITDLMTSDIGLAPLSDNSFTKGKCGFKILQYAAAGLPVIASPVGINSELVRDGITGFHATNISEWTEKIAVLVENSDLRTRMGREGKTDVGKYDTDVIGRRLAELLLRFAHRQAKGVNLKSEAKRTSVSDSVQPLISICIPTYNRKDYLRETIQSILDQTCKDYEIIIVDDGSTDGTEQMVRNLGIPVTYYWQPNGGDAAARNKLIELAKGKYISFIDSDDLLLPDAIERMLKVMEDENGDVIVYGSYYRIDKNGRIYGRCKRRLYSGTITKHLFKTILVHACGSLFPAKILRESPAFDTSLHICSDYDLWLRLSMKYKFIALSEPTFKRRRHETNLSVASMENCLIEYDVLKRFYENGGRKYIPRMTAAYILSKKQCRAGRYALKEGMYEKACELLGQSFLKSPNFKSLVYLLQAKITKSMTGT
jgi:glycosyltransferase involved in cell wall biosynthesis